jgi:hypothetical protein
MKKINLVVFLILFTSTLFGQGRISLQDAIDEFAKELTIRLQGNEKIAVVSFSTDKYEIMIEFFDNMIAMIMEHNKNVNVYERHRLKILLEEQNLSLTGLVSDDTAIGIGKLIGANTVIYGELINDVRKNEYKLTIRATNTETGKIILSPEPYNVRIGNNPYYWSAGFSAGTALFKKPFLIGTIRATLAPFQHSFLELGFDLGAINGKSDIDYFSLYPYANIAYFFPFNKCGCYVGTGIGYLYSEESSTDLIYRSEIIAMNILAGINIVDVFDISYTFRTNFEKVGNRLSVGYTYRFQ